MTRMIEQLLDFTRLRVRRRYDAGAAPDGPEARSSVRSSTRWRAPTRSGRSRWRSPASCRGTWDGDRLGQLFSNLLGNAVQHGSPEDGVRVRVDGDAPDTVRSRSTTWAPSRASCSRHVFDPLIGGERRRDKARGLGLGLFITREIATRARRRRRRHLDASRRDDVRGDVAARREHDAAREPRSEPPLALRRAPRRAERSPLQETEARFRLLVDAVKDYAIFMLDPSGASRPGTPAPSASRATTPSEIIGQHFSRFYASEDVRAGKCETRAGDRGRARAGSRTRAGASARTARSSGPTSSSRRCTTRAGELIGFAKVTRDLTERRRLEQERLGLARAQEAIRLRDEFLSLASHELKTPLTVAADPARQPARATLATQRSRSWRPKLQRAARSSDRLTRPGRVAARRLAHRDRQVRAGPRALRHGRDRGRLDRRHAPGARPRAGCELSLAHRRTARGRLGSRCASSRSSPTWWRTRSSTRAGAPIEVAVRGDGRRGVDRRSATTAPGIAAEEHDRDLRALRAGRGDRPPRRAGPRPLSGPRDRRGPRRDLARDAGGGGARFEVSPAQADGRIDARTPCPGRRRRGHDPRQPVEYLDENGYRAMGAVDGQDALGKLAASTSAPA